MRVLLDTHVVLWWLADSPDLPDDAKDLLDSEPEAYVSPVTVWEVAIKQALGKMKAPGDLATIVRDSGFRELPVRHQHAIAADRLPPHHRDPFDRMLVAQAAVEGLALMTHDARILRYDVTTYPV
jgi:PIN domain nuclease of toxin-antitoxin system